MTDRNLQLFERAAQVIPGGVNSPVRAFRAVGGTPRFVQRAQGAYFWDANGQKYIDYIGSWGPMILGHGHPAVLEAVQQAALDGFSFGAPTEREIELADPGLYKEFTKWTALHQEQEQWKRDLERLTARWESLSAELEGVKQKLGTLR